MLLPVGEEILFPEEWVWIPHLFVPGIANYYKISSWGRVLNTKTGNYLPQNMNYCKDKYITVRLNDIYGNPIYCQPHRLVMMCFRPVMNYHELDVNHKDCIKYHNWVWNLEWATRQENMNHAKLNNLFIKGEDRKSTKLLNDQVEIICELISKGIGPKEISNIMNIDNCNIEKIVQNIKNGHSWRFISEKYDIIRKR